MRRGAARGSGPPPRRRKRELKRWWILALPLLTVAGLVAIAPPLPRSGTPSPLARDGQSPKPAEPSGEAAGPFRYNPDPEAFSLDIDPRQVRFDLLDGWDREQEAYADGQALAFVSGPMYERYGAEGSASTVPLGDLKLGDRIWRGRNRSAARQRAFLGIRHDGQVEFGYGELTDARAGQYDTFIGGLHSVYNDLAPEPPEYKGAYSISMGQQIRYYLPRIRVIYGLRSDGRLAILMSRDGLTLEQTKALARERGFLAAYMPDHASKSRFIIPGVKGFSAEDANWISGGATSFVHVPYLLRLSQRPFPLSGNLLAGLTPQLSHGSCGDPLHCGVGLIGSLADRVLAGFNRLMEQGVEPLARLIWAPQLRQQPGQKPQNAPLREPVITADPQAVQERQQRDLAIRRVEPRPEPEPPTLPEPRGEQSGPAPASEAPAGTASPPPIEPPSTQAPEPTRSVEGAAGGPEPGAQPPAPPPTASPPSRPPAPVVATPPPLSPPPPLPVQARAALPVAPPPPVSPPPPLP